MTLHFSKDTAILSLKEALTFYVTAWYLLDIIIITEQKKKNPCTGKSVMVESYIK